MNKPNQVSAPSDARGFTLIELMVTLAVAAVLLGLAAPSFRDLAIRNELTTNTNELISTINYARSEAVRSGKPIVICSTKDDGESCSGSWSDGWITFTDLDGNGKLDTKTETIIKRHPSLSQGYWIDDGGAFSTGLTYRPDGSTESSGTFVICKDGELVGAHAVVITPMRPRVAQDTNDDRIPNDDQNKNVKECKKS